MATTYTGNPSGVHAPSPAPGPGVAPIITLPSGTDALDPTALNQPLETLADFAAYCTLRGLGAVYGDGSDGAATLNSINTVPWASYSAGVYTMTRDAFLTNLTVTGGATLKTNGFRIYGTGTLTTSSGTINNNGANASGQSGGAGGNIGTVGSGSSGAAGPASGGTAGNNGVGLAGALGGAGGNGGRSGSPLGGLGGTITNPSAATTPWHAMPSAMVIGWVWNTNSVAYVQLGGGAGGGSGASSVADHGYGGGAGGGVMGVFFRKIVLQNATDIQCHGGSGASADFGSTAGAGGGGGGGLLIVAYASCNQTFSSATNCAGGVAGLGAGGSQNGDSGLNGYVLNFNPGS